MLYSLLEWMNIDYQLKDVAFARHFVAMCLPPPSHPIGVLEVMAIPVKKLSKMAGKPAWYPMYSRYNELLLTATDL